MTKPIRIGLVLNQSYAYYRGVLRGIARFAEAKPQWFFTSIVPDPPSVRAIGRLRPAGLIASLNSRALVQEFYRWRRPVVNVSAVLPGLRYPRVGVDNARVGELAAAHFLERGLSHFAFIGTPDHLYSIERHAAYVRTLRRAGRDVHSHFANARQEFDPMGRRWDLDRNASRWLRTLPKPVGLFVPSDHWGIQVSEACRQAELHVPEDVALLGVDDDDLDCELTRPRMSSVIVPADRIGYEAAALLDRMLGGERPPAQPILIPPTGVATRRSTEVLAFQDRTVVASVRYIREHAHLPLSVADVVRQVCVGRRTLERRCHAALGRSLGREIRRAHLDLARRLLARTELAIAVVARQAGFTDFRHMGEVFRQELGMSPTAYRNRMRGDVSRVAR